MPGIKSRIQDHILHSRGLKHGRRGKLIPVSTAEDQTALPVYEPFARNRTNPLKTQTMLLLEYRHNQPIEKLLAAHLPLTTVAATLGIDFTTVSKWRKILGIRRTSPYGTRGAGRLPSVESPPDEIDPGAWDTL